MIGKIEFPEGITWEQRYVTGGDFLGSDSKGPEELTYFYRYAMNKTININFDISDATNMSSLFYGASNLTSIPQQLDTSNATAMAYMFYGCSKLITIPQLDVSNITGVTSMFYNCSQLAVLPDFNSVKVVSFGTGSNNWLYNCSNIQKIGIVDCDSVTDIRYFFGNNSRTYLTEFGGCRNLGKANTVSYTDGSYFMTYAPNLNYGSVMNVINGLYDRATAGLSVLTLKLHANHWAMLNEDDIAIATNKGWNLTT